LTSPTRAAKAALEDRTPSKTTALRFKPQLDGSIRQDGPFECKVLGPKTGEPEFKYVRFGESCNDWTVYCIHEKYIASVRSTKPMQRETELPDQGISFGR
jgi:hypothetical protein